MDWNLVAPIRLQNDSCEHVTKLVGIIAMLLDAIVPKTVRMMESSKVSVWPFVYKLLLLCVWQDRRPQKQESAVHCH